MALFVSFLDSGFLRTRTWPIVARIACSAGLVLWVLAVKDDWGSGRWECNRGWGREKTSSPQAVPDAIDQSDQAGIRVIADDHGMCLVVRIVVGWFLFRRLS